MTHLAISDPRGKRYRYAERLSRGGPGLAGAASDRYRVWNEDWSAGIADQGSQPSTVKSPHVLRAKSRSQASISFSMKARDRSINGINGISQKGALAGNASHYYSLTRMPTKGTIEIDGEAFAVTGDSWMDHEFGTSFLEPEQRGWDWLSIQLSDNRELMLYQLRRADGSRDPRSSGTLVDAAGKSIHLADKDFTLTPGRPTFKSKNGAVYPTEWTVAIPSQRHRARITTPLNDQELSLVQVHGHRVLGRDDRRPATGHSQATGHQGVGYLEMTGYHGSLGRVLSGREAWG